MRNKIFKNFGGNKISQISNFFPRSTLQDNKNYCYEYVNLKKDKVFKSSKINNGNIIFLNTQKNSKIIINDKKFKVNRLKGIFFEKKKYIYPS